MKYSCAFAIALFSCTLTGPSSSSHSTSTMPPADTGDSSVSDTAPTGSDETAHTGATPATEVEVSFYVFDPLQPNNPPCYDWTTMLKPSEHWSDYAVRSRPETAALSPIFF